MGKKMKLLHEVSLGNYQWISIIHITLTESDLTGKSGDSAGQPCYF